MEYRDDLNKFLNKQEEGYFPVNCSRPVNTSKQVFYLSPAVFTKEVSNENYLPMQENLLRVRKSIVLHVICLVILEPIIQQR